MMLFWAIAAAFTVAALLFLLPPLVRRRTTAPDARVAANAAIYREQLEELAAELQRGALTNEEFERASREIEHRVVAEHAGGAPAPATHRPLLAAALAIGLALPLVVVLGYWQLGNPNALSGTTSEPGHAVTLAATLAETMTPMCDVKKATGDFQFGARHLLGTLTAEAHDVGWLHIAPAR